MAQTKISTRQLDMESITNIILERKTSSIISGGTAGQSIPTATRKYVGVGHMSEVPYLVPIPYNGVIKNLRVWSDGSPGAGQVYYCIMMKNGVAQELDANILEGHNTAMNTTKSFAVTNNDRISLRVSLTANAAPSTFIWSVELESGIK